MLGSSREGAIRSAPAFSITGKQKSKLPQCVQFPGPGSYDSKLEFVLKKPPVFSMASRFNIPTDTHMKPGPGAHRPEKVCMKIFLIVEYLRKRYFKFKD